MHTIIYHNPDCGTSRNTLALIRACGIEPEIVYYLQTPPDENTLRNLLAQMGLSARDVMRTNVPPYTEQGLDNPELGEAELITKMCAYPLLINRPIVANEKGTLLCRPSEKVLALLPPLPQVFYKEDGGAIHPTEPSDGNI